MARPSRRRPTPPAPPRRAWTRAKPAALRAPLLAWYREHHRKLPWRAEPGKLANPYHEWLSEAMLQQTQVATVIAYFERFTAAFPTLADLARAEEQSVLRLWQGLGYYRRARNLHAAARAVEANHAGRLPDTFEGLLALPGIGRYSAGAIASIAFGRRTPVVDGNVARVLARWFAIEEPVDAPAVRERLWRLAEHLVPARHPGDFNQAVMELGALVCTPKSPKCLVCPVAAACRANKMGIAERLPVRVPRRKPTAAEHHVLAIDRRGERLFVQRPDRGLWSGMWEMPTVEAVAAGVDAVEALRALAAARGIMIDKPARVGEFDHQTTHRSIHFVVWRARCTGGRLRGGAWRRPGKIDDLPLPNPQRRALEMLEE
ncbi:MAG: A/G-specific adenine glycosylase [Planctomycetota bacterium]|nr:A/G-specific adenine glycosylase [Planctomycetota bacterium]